MMPSALLLCALTLVLAARPVGAQARPYHLLPESRFDVVTHNAGLFGLLGHEHRIRAHGVVGSIHFARDSLAVSSVDLTIAVDSLEVLTPRVPDEIREVTANMRHDVLHPDSFPTMHFRSDSVRAVGDSARIYAELTIEGVTRAMPVDVAVAFAGDTLHARATFDVQQTDFGIRPYRQAFGTVQVANRITFEIDAVAVPDVP